MNSANQLLAVVTLGVLTLSVGPAHAEAPASPDFIDPDDLDARREIEISKDQAGPRHRRMALEATGMLAIGTAWYWRNTGDGFGEANRVDWQLGFERGSLGRKLGFDRDGWRFDGNSFGLNAVGHPMFGALTYFSARKNRYGVLESFAISTLASGAWEMFTEWAEYGSINDALSTSPTGVVLGEAAHQLLRQRSRARYAIHAGAGAQAGDAIMSVGGRAAVDTTPTGGAGMVVGGNKIDVSAVVPFDGGLRAVEAVARTSLLGYYRNGGGYHLFAGTSAEFYYRDQKDRQSREWDLLATVAAGPTMDLQVRRGNLRLDVGADLYLDFGMLKAQAYDRWRQANPRAIVRNSMQDKAQPYYYARGASVDPRLNIAYRGLQLGGKLVLGKFDSLDGADRDQEMLTDDSHIEDIDTTAEAWIGCTRKDLMLTVGGRLHGREGSMGGHSARTSQTTTMVTLAYLR